MVLQRSWPMRHHLLIGLAVLVVGCGRGADKKDYSVPACIRDLGDTDPEIRCTAATVLGQYGGEAKSAVPALTGALSDPNKHVRACAAYALAEIGPDGQSAVPTLLKTARDPNPDVRAAASYALKRLRAKP